ncbi:hypothetical protein PNOK_0123100 [Pyrrhoderma noxium]|uniref:Uncharacterized protein n=1 Tax=Pyrrhoderma noxium TaxID=2282107 RepID=A0A286UX37_9AGAM|nr:hypothetical protein PNOK_0123100 [Pyrrhoderma noxium]
MTVGRLTPRSGVKAVSFDYVPMIIATNVKGVLTGSDFRCDPNLHLSASASTTRRSIPFLKDSSHSLFLLPVVGSSNPYSSNIFRMVGRRVPRYEYESVS